ncbi:MAG: acyl carrier protein [Chromatiales bacterium]|nr:acyl carrier protein [Chromatiales bacterium]MDX9767150.1 acyl carrier protein [Ectothiorhodospiraceae bacterium]
MTQPIETVLRDVIASHMKIEPATVVPEATLEQLGITSLDLVEIIMSIEDAYDVTMPLDANEAWSSIRTVGDIIALGHSLGFGGGD